MNNMKIKFPQNGKLKILQVSDPQDMHIVRRSMIRMLNKAYDRINPDIVLFTGDNILANHIDDAIIGTRKVVKTRAGSFRRMEKALHHILQPLEEREIPFAMIYGNHDDMNVFSKEELSEIYKKYKFFIGLNDDDKTVECDTFNIPIYGSDGQSVKYNIWMLDSAGHDINGENAYEYVTKATVDWYVRKSNELKKNNGEKPVMSLMFQHIPLPETLNLLIECNEKEKSSVNFGAKYYKLNPSLAKGTLGEYPGVCSENYGQFDAIKKQGDVSAVVFGHDHLNCFVGTLDGIDIVQTACASFRCYGNNCRGVRLFVVDEKNPAKFETEAISYFELFGKGLASRLRYIMDADDKVNQKYALLGIAGIVVLVSAATIHIKKYTKK